MFWKKYDVLTNKISDLYDKFYSQQQKIFNLEAKIEKLEKKLKEYDEFFGMEYSTSTDRVFTDNRDQNTWFFPTKHLTSTKLNNLMRFLGVEGFHKEAESGFRKIKK